MASKDLYLRSDSDKGESSPSKNLRLWSDADKIPVGGGWTGTICGVTNPAKINGISQANISKVNGVS